MSATVSTILEVPPHNLEAEESVLGAMLITPGVIPMVVERVCEDDFYRDSHRMIYGAIIEMHRQSMTPDGLLLTEHLKATGKLEKAGGASYIHTLVNLCPVAQNAPQYAEIVKSESDKRIAAAIGQSLIRGEISPSQAKKQLSVLCTPLSTQSVQKEKKLRSWSEVITDSAEGRQWLVEGLLPKTGLALLGGWAKEGKSTLAIHLCRAVAEGKSFLSRTTLAAPTVYVNYEMPEDYRAELMTGGNIPAGAFWADRPEPILRMEGVRGLIELCTAAIPIDVHNTQTGGLVVIDSFRGAFRVEDENSTEAGVVLRDLQKVAMETGWLILVIHHFNKTKKEFSGSGDFYAAPDVLIKWSRPDPNEPGTLKAEGRMAPVEPMAVSLNLDSVQFLGDAGQLGREKEEQRILSCLTTEPASANDVAAELDMPIGSARSYLAKLVEKGKCDRIGEGKRGSPYLYWRGPVTE